MRRAVRAESPGLRFILLLLPGHASQAPVGRGRSHLRRPHRAAPNEPLVPLAYGHVFRCRDPAGAESLVPAIRGWLSADAETPKARFSLAAISAIFCFPKGRVADATREVERVVELGRSRDDPLLKAWAWTLEATHVQDTEAILVRLSAS